MESKIKNILNIVESYKSQFEKDLSSDTRDISNNSTILFKLPIIYIDKKYSLQENIKSDLELHNNKSYSLYNYIFNPSSEYADKIIPMWSEYYTTDISFLNDTKYLIKNFKHIELDNSNNFTKNINNISEILNEIKEETGFYEKYKYIDINFFKFLNINPTFLQGMSLYNLTSPVISLMIPILMLIIPFFILKIQKIPISVHTYFNILMNVLKNHVIGKAIADFSKVGWDRRFFLLISVGFYFINIYQNIITCYTFYKNIYKIRDYLSSINNFLSYSINSITNLNKYCKSSYQPFIAKNESIKNTLQTFSIEITTIQLEKVNIKQITKIGNILRSFYQLFKNELYKGSIIYALHLNGYIENISNLQNNIKNKYINYCKFTKKESSFKEAYFAPLTNENPVKNTYNLNKNIVITGPNAAGKTTLLKTTLFNIILSQQIGVGFYKSALINPYKYIHSYINIPDTSERDSLFQAEARRCKEILDSIDKSDYLERHFCIFDEIYSGTNPTEAVASAFSFLNYISKFKDLDFMLTTHYILLCNMIDKNINIENNQMECINSKSKDLIYTYKLKNGISNIKGGISVLKELNYSSDIIDLAKTTIKNMSI